ncbi:DNA cytosine methyltransferase [Nostoc sp. JL23]|uniref:DNA cytosine methyltransferase n=1 Tax=Nostoc sp. JL23 TaxID=2815394 RepID=UPI001D511680|nr:DNA cytosine methyltransferase [Nostoc sp. JL23]MBN3875259.1 DNA cytosine methyltransferase [Nostoc sp. JL23]
MRNCLTSAHAFSGGGGDTEGAIAAGYCPIWAIESDSHACAVYRKRFPHVRLIESDITDLSDEFIAGLPVPDAYIFGSPCPDFSLAGKRAGLAGDRGQLFFEGLRQIRLLKPRVCVWENVRGILSADKATAFPQVIEAFTSLGYRCTWQLRNGSRHVPQNRERVFIVGYHCPGESDTTETREEIFS